MTLRVVIADDHPIVLAGLADILRDEGFEVVARAANGADALHAVRAHEPDILVLDLRMPVKDGLDVLRELQKEGLRTRVVVVTAAEGQEVTEAIRLGVRGVVLKDMAAKFIVDAVRRVHAGGSWIERNAAGAALGQLVNRNAQRGGVLAALTPRELQIARMTADGLRNKMVANRLAITEGTAKLHLHHVYEKLGVDGRVALARYLRNCDH